LRLRKLVVALSTVAMLLSATASTALAAKPVDVGIKHVGPNFGQGLPVVGGEKIKGQPPLGPAKVGTTRTWLALNSVQGIYYLKNYTLTALRGHVEVWVANNLAFPAGDCRNDDPARLNVTSSQAQYLADQFEDVMYPIESDAFSVPPDRDGHRALLPKLIPNLPSSEYKGEGENIVVLVDNVRDENYYDTDNQNTLSYIAGFFSTTLNTYFNRNVMTIDSWDWLHRTTANPPNEPSTDPCTSAPARPFLYEGVFAHEYQHLLESYEDPDETTWVNEGLSDFAIELTGYGDPSLSIDDSGFDSHIQCFLGWLGVATAANPIPRPTSGPENSLTEWSDQGDGEILCDYGAAYSFMLMLEDRYGLDFMTALHRNDLGGFAGLQAVLDQFGIAEIAQDLVHDWAAMMALDAVLDDGASLAGSSADLEVGSLNASIRWDTPEAYSTPGAPPNGSDYVRLRNGADAYLGAGAIDSISFDGSSTVSDPVKWTVDDGALYSGSGDNLDRMIAREVAVPAGSPTLTFDAKWNTEPLWDFGFVQVSTDGGETFTSLSTADTTTDHDPDADPTVVANLPGFTGASGDPAVFRSQTADLSDYAGQDVILAFRYITDGAVALPGFWIDNVAINGSVISDGTDLGAWQSLTELNPLDTFGFTVQLIAYNDAHTAAWIGEIPLDENFDGTLSGAALDAVIGTGAQTVAAIVTYDEPTESINLYARYTLTVNGVTQPGG
jgi:hypothetical protein